MRIADFYYKSEQAKVYTSKFLLLNAKRTDKTPTLVFIFHIHWY